MDNINLDPQQIQQMILMLQSMLPKPEQQVTEVEDKPVSKKNNASKRTKKTSSISKTKSKPVRENKFDSMMEARMHKEDIAIDKKLSVLPPVPRARPFEWVNAVCRVCGKREKVNPVLITDSIDRYKCNKCATGAG